MTCTEKPLEVAIIGGGIAGLALAAGLMHRHVSFTLYERADKFGELGVGITITPNAERAMRALDPSGALQSFLEAATGIPVDTLDYVDGFHEPPSSGEDVLFRLRFDKNGYKLCRRCDFVDQVARHVPPESVRYGKWLDRVETDKTTGRSVLFFRDGTKADADVVIGCDGVRSRVRAALFGDLPSVPRPQYSHQFAYRGMVPLSVATEALGPARTTGFTMYTGPCGFILTLPLTSINALHVEVFYMDPEEWPEEWPEENGSEKKEKTNRYIRPSTRDEVARIFSGFGSTVRTIVSLLPEPLDKWAIFDLRDAPPPSYAGGSLCLAGDAAHATTPNHGAGAGMGIEDALVLAELLAVLAKRPAVRADEIAAALAVYSDVRYERARWLVASSRRTAELMTWKGREYGVDPEGFGQDLTERSHKLWDYDVGGMVREALEKFATKLETRLG